MSYAGCYATIFVLTAKKMRVSLRDLEVESEAVKSQEAGTITEVSFDVSVKADVSEDRIRRIHEVTLKTCAVGKIFDKAGVKSSFRVNTAKE
jgi:putative redox protein